jgi:uroporphyrinogen-III synthase
MTRPLQNKLFISTRPAGASDELKSFIERRGATVMEFPLIEIKAASLSNEEKEYFSRTGRISVADFNQSQRRSLFF